MTDMMNIGMSSLSAYKNALSVAGENIANANTPYYSRRKVDFTESLFGGGVNVTAVGRIYDEQANRFAQSASSDLQQADMYMLQLQNFEPLLSDSTLNIGSYITNSVNALNDLNHDPSSNSNRSGYLSRLQGLVERFQSVSKDITARKVDVNQSISVGVSQANDLLESIAKLNQQILIVSPDQQSTLADTREAQVQELAKFLNVNVSTDDQGVVNVTLTNGVPLVLGSAFSKLATVADPADATNTLVTLQSSGGSSDLTNLITGGKIAGLINFRKNALDVADRGIGRLSLAFSQAFNAQNALGLDGNGTFGGNIFADINAVGSTLARVIANTNNTGVGNMSVAITDTTQLTTSDYQFKIDASNNYVLTRLSDNKTVTTPLGATFPQTVTMDGFTMTINAGTYNSGDKYLVSPTKAAAVSMNLAINDPLKLALAIPVTANPVNSNVGKGDINVTSITNPSNSAFATPGQLSPPINVVVDPSGTTYTLFNATTNAVLEANIPYTSGADVFPTPGGIDPGYRVTLTGAVAAGDTFNIAYNTKYVGDHVNGDKIAALYDKSILEKSTATFNQGYNSVSIDISMKTQQSVTGYKSKQILEAQASDRRDKISGVSIEEETLDLARFQQAYQASAQILQSAKSIFEMVISITRG